VPVVLLALLTELAVAEFAPTGGPPGTRVVLSGTAFGADTRVVYDGRSLPILARDGTTRLTVAVPLTAKKAAPFVVRSRGQEVRTGAYFELALPPAIESLSPTAGPPGTRITVRGLRLTELYLRDAPLPILDHRDDVLVAEIPPGAASGPLSVAPGVRTPFSFEVVPPLEIASFVPESGPPGGAVTLAGRFGAQAAVRYGTLPCRVRSRAAGRLVIVVPAAARARDYFWVEDLGQRVRAAAPFTVTALPENPFR
jgi:IPT/TIG domain